jgi:aminoglycoside 2'-N-acetyltransferase I
MTGARLRTALSDQLGPELLDELTRLCEAAFQEPFAANWDLVGPGVHVMAEVDGRVVAHAMVVDRRIYVGDEMDVALDAGYVEHVATLPEAGGQGHGSTVMREINRIIQDEYAIGGLGTGSIGFYERLGWETWLGPTSVRMADGERVRSPREDGHVMILRTPRTPATLALDAPIAVDWRAGDPW